MFPGRFRGFVGVLLWCARDGKYLLLKRGAHRDVGSGTWECVTGRLNQGESFTEALHREAHEELGAEVQVDFIVGTGHFYRGERIAENEMIGVQYCASVDNPDAIRLSDEHSEGRWVTAEDAYGLLPDGHWLAEVIRRAEAFRALVPSELVEFHRTRGLELSA
jgi:8-oxo-dGTP diphosphatase